MQWVTFDCYGTLIDWNAGFTSVLRPLAGSRTPALLDAYHRSERAVEKERPFRSYKAVLVESLMRASNDLELAISDEQTRGLPLSWELLRTFPDVEPMLASLRSTGYSLGVLTNCDDDLFALTQRAFVAPFDMVITAEQVQDYKPSLAHFHRFAAVAAPSDWIHVACSWYHDIAPARALGVKRIWLDRDGTGDDPAAASARVESADEVCAAIASLP
jgi:2-haloacid dehalogenase